MRSDERRATRLERFGLTAMDSFLGVSAVMGGVMLLTGWFTPPRDLLAGSPFSNYVIPGLALLVLIGGGSLTAAMLLARHSRWGTVASALTGLTLLAFEAIEFMVIGFTGLLAFEVVTGLLLVAIATHLWIAGQSWSGSPALLA